MKKFKFFGLCLLLAFTLPYAYGGCSGGGGSGGSDSSKSSKQVSPSKQVLPSEHNYGIVTLANMPAPLEVKIKNNGSANLAVSDIFLSDPDNFKLDLNGGSNPCNTSFPTITVGDVCSVEVAFEPTVAGSFNAALTINSNDNDNPSFRVNLSGIFEAISDLTVRINQVETDLNCPAAQITAYVSVTDQGGYPVTNLTESNFTVFEDDSKMDLTDFSFVSQVFKPISVAIVLDYSGSITREEENVVDMQEAAAEFIDQFGGADEAEIVKFATDVEVMQAFTSNKDLLHTAIITNADIGAWTALYDGVWQAVDDTASRVKDRKAVIVMTDGVDVGPDGNQMSSKEISDVIDYANDSGIPIFTIGVGNFDTAVLEQMAEDTGGQFYKSDTLDNLRTIYRQLAELLFENQYILDYDSALGAGLAADLKVKTVVAPTSFGEHTKEITPCP